MMQNTLFSIIINFRQFYMRSGNSWSELEDIDQSEPHPNPCQIPPKPAKPIPPSFCKTLKELIQGDVTENLRFNSNLLFLYLVCSIRGESKLV